MSQWLNYNVMLYYMMAKDGIGKALKNFGSFGQSRSLAINLQRCSERQWQQILGFYLEFNALSEIL